MATKDEIRAEVAALAEEHDLEIPFGIFEASGEPAERERQFQAGLEEFRAGLPDSEEIGVTSLTEQHVPEEGAGFEAVLAFVVGQELADRIIGAGFDSPEALDEAENETLLNVEGVGPATLKKLREEFPRELVE